MTAISFNQFLMSRSRGIRNALFVLTLAAAGMVVPSYTWAQSAASKASASQVALDTLVKAAKSEGAVTWYSTAPESVSLRVINAFSVRYGFKPQFIRLPVTPLLQRYASEAEAGNIAGDILYLVGAASVAHAEQAIKKGWMEPISESGLPTIISGEFPARFNKGATAMTDISPWIIAYNTDKVTKAEMAAVQDWTDLLQPKFKGQLLIADPRASDAYMEFWTMLMDKYGDSFLTRLKGQMGRQYSSGVPAIQGLAAGEGYMHFPTVVALMDIGKSKGAPLDASRIEFNTAIEGHIMLTNRSKAKHPAAARLLANYLMSREGNAVFNDGPGSFSVYEGAKLPKQYVAPRADASTNKDKLAKLLGYQ